MLDLEPATSALAAVIGRVSDDRLGDPTPCTDTTVGDLIDHVDSFCVAFTAAARKTPLPRPAPAPAPSGARLGVDWRSRIPGRLRELAEAWRDPHAWQGMTEAGGVQMPGELTGAVALDEVIVHGWDIAVATGQRFSCPDDLVHVAYGFVEQTVAANPTGTPGLFGPPLALPESAPLLDRLIGLTGRRPEWPEPGESRDAGV
jgi:uncharacterized protein (TIGR03086 family)